MVEPASNAPVGAAKVSPEATPTPPQTDVQKHEQAANQAHAGLLSDALGTIGSTVHDAVGSFENTFQSQFKGAAQFSNRVFGTHLDTEAWKPVQVDDPNKSWSAWGANLVGQAGAMAVEFLAFRKAGALFGAAGRTAGTKLLGEAAGEPVAGIGGLPKWPAGLGALRETTFTRYGSSIAFGGVMGGVLTPNQSDNPNDFWKERRVNFASSIASMVTMTGTGHLLEGVGGYAARTATSSAGLSLARTLANPFTSNMVGGYAGGFLGNYATARLSGQTFDVSQANRAGWEFALMGVGTHSLNLLGEQRAGTNVTNARYFSDKVGLTQPDASAGTQAQFRVVQGSDRAQQFRQQVAAGDGIKDGAQTTVQVQPKVNTLFSGLFGDRFTKYGAAGTLLLSHNSEISPADARRVDWVATCAKLVEPTILGKDVFRGRSKGPEDQQPVWLTADAQFRNITLDRGSEKPTTRDGSLEPVRLGDTTNYKDVVRHAVYADAKGNVRTARILMADGDKYMLGARTASGSMAWIAPEESMPMLEAKPIADGEKPKSTIFSLEPIWGDTPKRPVKWTVQEGDKVVTRDASLLGEAGLINGVPYRWIEVKPEPPSRDDLPSAERALSLITSRAVPSSEVFLPREATPAHIDALKTSLGNMKPGWNNLDEILPTYGLLAKHPELDEEAKKIFLANVGKGGNLAAVEALEGFYHIPGNSIQAYLPTAELKTAYDQLIRYIESPSGDKSVGTKDAPSIIVKSIKAHLDANPGLSGALRQYARLLQSDPRYAGNPDFAAQFEMYQKGGVKPRALEFAKIIDAVFDQYDPYVEPPSNTVAFLENFGGTARKLNISQEELDAAIRPVPEMDGATFIDPLKGTIRPAGEAATGHDATGATDTADTTGSTTSSTAPSAQAALALSQLRTADPAVEKEGVRNLLLFMHEPAVSAEFDEWRSHAVRVFPDLGDENLAAAKVSSDTLRDFLFTAKPGANVEAARKEVYSRIATLKKLAGQLKDAPDPAPGEPTVLDRLVELTKNEPSTLERLANQLERSRGDGMRKEIIKRFSSSGGTVNDLDPSYLDTYSRLGSHPLLKGMTDVIAKLQELSKQDPATFKRVVEEPNRSQGKPKPPRNDEERQRQDDQRNINRYYMELVGLASLRTFDLQEVARIGDMAKNHDPNLETEIQKLIPEGSPPWAAIHSRVMSFIDQNPNLVSLKPTGGELMEMVKNLPETEEMKTARLAKEKADADAAEAKRLEDEAARKKLAEEAEVKRLTGEEADRRKTAAEQNAATMAPSDITSLMRLDQATGAEVSDSAGAQIARGLAANPLDHSLYGSLMGDEDVVLQPLLEGNRYADFADEKAAEQFAQMVGSQLAGTTVGLTYTPVEPFKTDIGFVPMIELKMPDGETVKGTISLDAGKNVVGISRFAGEHAQRLADERQRAVDAENEQLRQAEQKRRSSEAKRIAATMSPTEIEQLIALDRAAGIDLSDKAAAQIANSLRSNPLERSSYDALASDDRMQLMPSLEGNHFAEFSDPKDAKEFATTVIDHLKNKIPVASDSVDPLLDPISGRWIPMLRFDYGDQKVIAGIALDDARNVVGLTRFAGDEAPQLKAERQQALDKEEMLRQQAEAAKQRAAQAAQQAVERIQNIGVVGIDRLIDLDKNLGTHPADEAARADAQEAAQEVAKAIDHKAPDESKYKKIMERRTGADYDVAIEPTMDGAFYASFPTSQSAKGVADYFESYLRKELNPHSIEMKKLADPTDPTGKRRIVIVDMTLRNEITQEAGKHIVATIGFDANRNIVGLTRFASDNAEELKAELQPKSSSNGSSGNDQGNGVPGAPQDEATLTGENDETTTAGDNALGAGMSDTVVIANGEGSDHGADESNIEGNGAANKQVVPEPEPDTEVRREFAAAITPDTKLENIAPMETGEVPVRDRAGIPQVVEPPLVPAVEALYDRNIRTIMSSANYKDVATGTAHIVLDLDTLSSENQEIAKSIGKVDEKDGTVTISVPVTADSTVGSIQEAMSKIVDQFKPQPLEWGYQTPEQSFRVHQPDASVPFDEVARRDEIDPVSLGDRVYVPELDLIFRSAELAKKYAESHPQTEVRTPEVREEESAGPVTTNHGSTGGTAEPLALDESGITHEPTTATVEKAALEGVPAAEDSEQVTLPPDVQSEPIALAASDLASLDETAQTRGTAETFRNMNALVDRARVNNPLVVDPDYKASMALAPLDVVDPGHSEPHYPLFNDEVMAGLFSSDIGEYLAKVTGGKLAKEQPKPLNVGTDDNPIYVPLIKLTLPSGGEVTGTISLDANKDLIGLSRFAYDGAAQQKLFKDLNKKSIIPEADEIQRYGTAVIKGKATSPDGREMRGYMLENPDGERQLVGLTIARSNEAGQPDDQIPTTLAGTKLASFIGKAAERAEGLHIYGERTEFSGAGPAREWAWSAKQAELPGDLSVIRFDGALKADETPDERERRQAEEQRTGNPREGFGATVFEHRISAKVTGGEPITQTTVVYPGGLKVSIDSRSSIAVIDFPGGAHAVSDIITGEAHRYTGLGVDALPKEVSKIFFDPKTFTLTIEVPPSSGFPEGGKIVRTANGALEITGARAKAAASEHELDPGSVATGVKNESDPNNGAATSGAPAEIEVAHENDQQSNGAGTGTGSQGTQTTNGLPLQSDSTEELLRDADGVIDESDKKSASAVDDTVVITGADSENHGDEATKDAPPEGASAPPEGASAPPEGASAPPEGASAPPEGTPPEGPPAPPEGPPAELAGDQPPPEGDQPPQEEFVDVSWPEQLEQVEKELGFEGDWALSAVNSRVLASPDIVRLGDLPHLSPLAFGDADITDRGFAAFEPAEATPEAEADAEKSADDAVGKVKSLLESVLPPDAVTVTGEVYHVTFGDTSTYIPMVQLRWHNGTEDTTRTAIDIDVNGTSVFGLRPLSGRLSERTPGDDNSIKLANLFKQLEPKVSFAEGSPSDSKAYEVLGIGRNATSDAIRTVYEQEMAAWDPVNFEGDAEMASRANARREELTEAYNILSDAQKRIAYDKNFGFTLQARERELHLGGTGWMFNEVNSQFNHFDKPIDLSQNTTLQLQRFADSQVADRGIATMSTEAAAVQLKDDVVAKLQAAVNPKLATITGGVQKIDLAGAASVYMPWVKAEFKLKTKDTLQAPLAMNREGIVVGLSPLSGVIPIEAADAIRGFEFHRLKQAVAAEETKAKLKDDAPDSDDNNPPAPAPNPTAPKNNRERERDAAAAPERPARPASVRRTPVRFDEETERKLEGLMLRDREDHEQQLAFVDKLVELARKDGNVDINRWVEKLEDKFDAEKIKRRLEQTLNDELEHPGITPPSRLNADYIHMQVKLPDEYKFMPGVADRLLSLYEADGRALNNLMIPPRFPKELREVPGDKGGKRNDNGKGRAPKAPAKELRYIYRDVMGVLSLYTDAPEPLEKIAMLLRPRLPREQSDNLALFRKKLVENSNHLLSTVRNIINENDPNWDYVNERLIALAATNPNNLKVSRPIMPDKGRQSSADLNAQADRDLMLQQLERASKRRKKDRDDRD